MTGRKFGKAWRSKRYPLGVVEYGAQQPSAPPPAGDRACSKRQEGDEYVCHCGARWDTHEERPPCRFNGGY